MRSIEVTVTIAAGARTCFDFLADPANVTRYMSGITSYEPAGVRTEGRGARFRSVAEIAGRRFPAVLEITEWVDGERIVATAVEGVRTQGSWTLEEFDDGTTDVTLLHEYELPGAFRLLPSGPVNAGIRRELERSLDRLKKLIEAV
ncbi:MAG TPA: SRPBCC family protein [Candidatus Dormibacteraeota bacterium]|nr:SRPBCC family protein [Candidatus Dormibacteraeota bacterium]